MLLRYKLGASDKQYLVCIDKEQDTDGETVYAVRVAFGITDALGRLTKRTWSPEPEAARLSAHEIIKDKISNGYVVEAVSA